MQNVGCLHLIPTNTNVMKSAKCYGEQRKSGPRKPSNSEESGDDASIAIEYDDKIRTQHSREILVHDIRRKDTKLYRRLFEDQAMQNEGKNHCEKDAWGTLPLTHQFSNLQGTNATTSMFTINLSNFPPETKGTFSFETGPNSGGPPAGSGVAIKRISSSANGTAPLFSTLHLKLSSSAAGSVIGMGIVIGGETNGLPNESPIMGEWSMLLCIIVGDRYGPSRGFGTGGDAAVGERSSEHSTTQSTGQMYPPAVQRSSGVSLYSLRA